MSDNGMSLTELRALAQTVSPEEKPPPSGLPVERLINFMDVRAITKRLYSEVFETAKSHRKPVLNSGEHCRSEDLI